MHKVLVTGSSGQVGSELQELCKGSDRFVFADRAILDITNKQAVETFCEMNSITHIINTAAYTAVDKAEDDKENAKLVNHIAVKNLSEVAKEKNITLAHISTDYVFDGTSCRPYVESDETNPQGVYGATKLAGEEAMRQINPKNSIIIRTSWVYSSFGNNFVKTMLRLSKQKDTLGVIFDQIGTPTYARDLASAILKILTQINNETVETYHYSNEGVCSWFDFAKAIFELSDADVKVNAITTKEYPTPAKRPHYSVLDKSKIKQKFQIVIPYWKDSLKQCLQTVGEDGNVS